MRTSTRRQFLQHAIAGLTIASAPRLIGAAQPPAAWTVGCLNRPWTKWSADEMLDGIKAAGYRVIGLQTPTPADPFVAANATPEYLAALKEKIARRGLVAIEGRLRTQEGTPLEKVLPDLRRQIDNARQLGLQGLINTGTAKVEHYESWYRQMAAAAAYGADHGVKILTKPHGGVVGDGKDLLRCLEKINHPNVGIWYDAGNIIHYTGKDPLEELEPVIAHVTAFTAKDCAGKGGEVMLQFGQGRVDFAGIFRRLKRAGFQGPVMVESCAIGATAEETTANARANRVFLERQLAAV